MKTRVKKEFRVVKVGETNLFHLRGYTLLARNGESYEVCRSDGEFKKPWTQGQDISVDVEIEDGIETILWGYVNVDRENIVKLPHPQRQVVEEAFSDAS